METKKQEADRRVEKRALLPPASVPGRPSDARRHPTPRLRLSTSPGDLDTNPEHLKRPKSHKHHEFDNLANREVDDSGVFITRRGRSRRQHRRPARTPPRPARILVTGASFE